MNQALYAHMNNKRKMKKKKRTFSAFKVKSQWWYFKLSWIETYMNCCCFIVHSLKMQMIVPKITNVYTPDVLIIQKGFFLAAFILSYISLNLFYHITLL
jgi:hypothetical protein